MAFDKIIHLADIHIMDDAHILKDVSTAAESIKKFADTESPDAIVIAGDLFHERLPFDSPAVFFAIDFVKAMASIAPVYLLRGTRTHDFDAVGLFNDIATRHPVRVITEPEIISVGPDTDMYCLPGIKKSMFAGVAKRAGMDDIGNVTAMELVELQFNEWQKYKEKMLAGRGTVFLGHIQLGLEQYENMETGYEPGISPETIDGAISPSLGMLGHVHNAGIHGRYVYAGSLVSLTMSDAMLIQVHGGKARVEREFQPKGFFCHVNAGQGRWKSDFIPVPGTLPVRLSMGIMSADGIGGDMEVAERAITDASKNAHAGRTVARLHAAFAVGNDTRAVQEFLGMEEKLRGALSGKGIELLSPKMKMEQFSVRAKRTGDGWPAMTVKEKFFKWADEKGYDIKKNQDDAAEIDKKIDEIAEPPSLAASGIGR